MASKGLPRQLSPTALLVILTGLNLFNYLDRYVLSAVRTPIASQFGLDYEQSGRLFTIFMLGYFLTSPIFGYLAGRISRKILIVVGILVWSVGTVLTGLATSFTTLLCFRALVGVGEASYATLSPGLISDVYPPGKRNNALTIFYVAIPVGSAIGYALGGEITTYWSWRYAFYWAGVPGFLLSLVLLPFREPERGQAEGLDAKRLQVPGIRAILHLFAIRDYNLILCGYVAYTFALGAFAFWGPTFLQKVHGLAIDQADDFFGGALVVAGIGGTLFGGFLATWWHRHTPAGYAWLLGASVLLAVPISFCAVYSMNTPLAMALLGVSIFLLFFSTGPINTLILEAVPVNLRSSAIALSIFMIHLFGDMYSPQIVGWLVDYMNGNLQRAILLLPITLLIAASLWMILAIKTMRTG